MDRAGVVEDSQWLGTCEQQGHNELSWHIDSSLVRLLRVVCSRVRKVSLFPTRFFFSFFWGGFSGLLRASALFVINERTAL